MSYYTINTIKITDKIYIADGIQYPNPQWFDGATDEQLIELGIVRHDDPVKPDYDSNTHALSMNQDRTNYIVTPLTNEQIKANAKNKLNEKLNSMTYTYADGRVIQTRPSDLTNIQLTVANGQDEEWIMHDDTLSIMTAAELQEAMLAGISLGKSYWDEYKEVIRSLT